MNQSRVIPMSLLPPPPFIPTSPHTILPSLSLQSHNFMPRAFPNKATRAFPITCSSSSPHKLFRDRRLDKHVTKQNKIRFVQKLKTLLLSKPKHFMPIQILQKKCRSFLSLPKPRSILSMIRRYPTVFELFSIPTPLTPFHASGPLSHLCVRLTPSASALAKREIELKNLTAHSSASKLQKLLMLAGPHHRLVLSKLAHLGPDLGLPVNFRSRLCNEHPDKFKVVETSYGRALELVSWDSSLAKALPIRVEDGKSLGLIVDRPLKFDRLRLRKGLNVKRRHREFLVRFMRVPDVCPYTADVAGLGKESIEAEKRACAVAREVLRMTVEKRTLVDHLTHFRNEFGLPNKLRGMLVRHPEMFYVSLKGQRDSVFLVEGYSDKGALLEKDETLVIRDELMKLVMEGKRMRRERIQEYIHGDDVVRISEDEQLDDIEYFDECEDGLDDLFQVEDYSSENDELDDESDEESRAGEEEGEYWRAEIASEVEVQKDLGSEPW